MTVVKEKPTEQKGPMALKIAQLCIHCGRGKKPKTVHIS